MTYQKLNMVNTTEYSVYRYVEHPSYVLWYKKGEGCRINKDGVYAGHAPTIKAAKIKVEKKIKDS